MQLIIFSPIDCYLDLIVQRNNQDNSLMKIYAFDTHFWTKYNRDGFGGVKNWTQRAGVNIFEKDALFIPMFFGDHWVLTIIDFRGRRACCYDSLGIDRTKEMSKLMEYLKFEQDDKNMHEYDLSNIQMVDSQKAPGECVENFHDYFDQLKNID